MLTGIGGGAIAAQHVVFESLRYVAPGILKQADEIVGRVTDQRVLEVDQTLLASKSALFQQHDVFRMIVTQHRDAGFLTWEHGSQRFFPGGLPACPVDCQTYRGAIPFHKQRRFALVHIHIIGFEGTGRQPVKLHQRVDRLGIDIMLLMGMIVDPFLHPRIAEILGQHPALGRIFAQDFGPTQAIGIQPFGNMQKWLGVLMRRRCMHQHRALSTAADAEIAAEAGIAHQRGNFGTFPTGRPEEGLDVFKYGVAHGIRLCQASPGFTMACLPSPTVSSVIARQVASCSKPPA